MRKLVISVVFAMAASAAPASAADNVAVGHSGWIWGNPQPQGSTLNDIEFAGGSGYAVGEAGVLLKTTNGGLTWQGLATGVRSDLDRVRALDANVLFAGGGCSLVRSDDGGVSFARLGATTRGRNCAAEVASFSFADPLTGYVLLSNGAVARTTDGGHTFVPRASLPGTAAAGGAPPATASDLWFLSGETGSALSGKTIQRTTDGGASWTESFAAGAQLNSLYFVSATTGYAAGDEKTLLKTTDGGVTWTPLDVSADLPAADLTALRCASGQPNLCLVSTRQGDQLLRTANGGNTFTSVIPYAERKVLAAAFSNPGLAAAVGQGGATAVSADGGKNWAPVGVSVGEGLDRLRTLPSGAVAVTGADGALARTVNGGADWNSIEVPTTKAVLDTAFTSDSVGYALDAGDALFKTVDGGTHWTPSPATGVSGARAVLAPDADTVLLLGSAGIARSVDGGATFDKPKGAALSDWDRAGSGLVLYGARALFAASADGLDRKRMRRPGSAGSRIASADFFDRLNGYVLNGGGRLWLTRNGGKSWAEIRTTGTASGYDMVWSDANTGYLAVDTLVRGDAAGFLMRTDDRGKHWRPQLVAPTPLRDIVTTARQDAVALAGGSQLLYTSTGGNRGATSTLTIEPNKLTFKKPTKVKISGRIAPAAGGAEVHVAIRDLYGGAWTTRVAETGASGRFSTKLKVSKSSVVVARWLGDASLNGAGSNILAIRRTG